MIDSHCHLDVDAFDADRAEVIARARSAGVTGILVPAIRPRTWAPLVELVHREPLLRVALGVRPQIVPELDAGERALDVDGLCAAIDRAGARAVGECGLDGGTGERELQEQLFRLHIRAANQLGLPLVVHVLRAHDVAPRILREERCAGGVMHSYSGGAQLVGVYRDLGFAFSFAGPVTYPNSRKPVEAARVVPRELLLAETDAPDQAPAARRGQRCEPAFLLDVIAGLAAARGEPIEAIAALTTETAKRLLRW
jgi:TatD DNase family protein